MSIRPFYITTAIEYANGEPHLGHAFHERSYEGLYSIGCEAFKTAHDLDAGACPLHPTRPLESPP